jgi:predicted nucleic acid-binding protein
MSKNEIRTKYIFLDTSIFIKENFLDGNKIKAFFKHAEEENIELLITEITLKECISNLSKSFDTSYTALKRVVKNLNSDARIFHNVESLNEVFKLKRTFEYEKEKNDLIERFETQINKHFRDIEIDEKNLDKIISDYFDSKPPFGKESKKHEFPDALVLNSLESWCKKNREKIYVVSTDGDMISFTSKNIITIKEYDKLLDEISFTYSDENITRKIDEIIEDKKEEILALVKDKFVEDYPYSGIDEYQGFDYDVINIDVSLLFIEKHSVLTIYDNIATVELSIPIEYSAEVHYADVYTGWYDNEEKRWFGVEYKDSLVSDNAKLSVIFEIEVELPGVDVDESLDFIEISSGIPFNLGIED